MKEFNIQVDFAVSVPQFFDLFFLNPKFKLDFHVVRGDTEISVGDWKELGNNKYERAIKFCSQVSDQVIFKKLTGGIAPVVHEKQDYEFVNKVLHVSSVATSAAGGFNCSTTADYTITEIGKIPSSSSSSSSSSSGGVHDGCHVDIVVKSEFKSRLFKGQVENMMTQQASQTFEQWIALVKSKIVEFHKEEQLRSRQRQPLPIPDYLTDTLSSSPSTTENSEYDTDDESYYDAPDHLLTSPSISRSSTPVPSQALSSHPSHSPSSTSSAPPPTLTGPLPMSFPPAGGISALVHNMHKELQQLRSMTEVNSSRLLGLESSFKQGGGHPSLPSHPSTNNEGLMPYLQRLDLLMKQQEEEIQRSREKEQEWKRRIEEMEARLGGTGRGRGLMPWGRGGGWGGWGMLVFLLVWPVMAQKLWKYAKVLHPVVAQAFWRMLGR